MMQQTEASVYYAILAGGSGERLWPLSRRAKPKQLLPFLHETSLLEQTVRRTRLIAPRHHTLVVTTTEYEDQVTQLLADQIGFVIAEPASRNTAAAITLLSLLLYERDPHATVVILPADHYIPADTLFISFLHHLLDYARHNKEIVLMGVRPTYPETSYGYIEYASSNIYPAPVVQFHEKPSAQKAKYYLSNPRMLWNTGIICAQVSVLLEEIQLYAPEVYQTVFDYVRGIGSYDDVQAHSFDTLVLEQSKRCAVLPVDLVWVDVGNLISYLAVQEVHQQLNGNVIAIDAEHNLVDVKDKLVVLIGVDDVCIVQTDDVLLIARRTETDKIKQVLDALRSNSGHIYL